MPSSPSRGPSTTLIVVLVVGMLLTGASNSLWSKWQDMQCVSGCDDPDPSRHKLFEQPTWQTATMFLGETLCLAAFSFISSRFNPFRPATRASASAAARKAAFVSHANSARLHNAPLSRPDESAIFFNESDISLMDERTDDYEERASRVDKVEEIQGWGKALLFWAPAACDICGTTAMNVGLIFVPVSVYQMLRGALVLWVGVLSVVFLNRKLVKAQWLALATVMLGIAVVGLSSVTGKPPDQYDAVVDEKQKDARVGIALILVAQLFTASQFVLEEKIMESYHVEPLLAVGYEGFFGFFSTLFFIAVLHFFIGQTPAGRGGYFDAPTGWNQMVQNPSVWGSSIAIAVSIAFFNFCGLAVTKSISATARSTIDSCRTTIIWIFSLALGWEQFAFLQVVGFGLLVYGTFVFNGITKFPAWTGFHDSDIPSISLIEDDPPENEDEEEDEEVVGRSRSVDTDGLQRPATRRSGSGRRGEHSPLLKTIID